MSVTHSHEMESHTTKLTLKDKDGYHAALTKAGITPDWVHFGNHEVDKTVFLGRGGANLKYNFSGYPVKKANMVVPNPKDVVTKALPNIPQLRKSMQATLIDIMLGNWVNGSTANAAQAYSMPVFMLVQAVDNMAQAKALGKKEEEIEAEEEKRKKNFIVLIVSVVLMVRARST